MGEAEVRAARARTEMDFMVTGWGLFLLWKRMASGLELLKRGEIVWELHTGLSASYTALHAMPVAFPIHAQPYASVLKRSVQDAGLATTLAIRKPRDSPRH
jgi:hypothetical protein